jgi:hypothetical protein
MSRPPTTVEKNSRNASSAREISGRRKGKFGKEETAY